MPRFSDSSSAQDFNDFRKQLELNITDFALLVGCHASQVSRWELGDFKPNEDNLYALNALYEEYSQLFQEKIKLRKDCNAKKTADVL